MTSKRLYPHFTETVKAFQFLYVEEPSSINTYTDIPISIRNDNIFWLDTSRTPHMDDYFIDDLGWLVSSVIHQGNLDFRWNIIVARSSGDDRLESYLSVSYWNIPISADEAFKKLQIKYFSSYEVVPYSNTVTVEVDYINHVIEEGTGVDTSTIAWNTHKNMYRKVSNTIFPKTTWVLNNVLPRPSTSNDLNDRVITGYAGTASIPLYSDSTKDLFYRTESSSVEPYNVNYNCIPKVTESGCKLIVSPRFGVEFYNKSHGKIYSQPNESTSQVKILGAPIFDESETFEVYRYGVNVILFYDPTSYSAWVSCKLPGLDNDGYETWETPWRVGKFDDGSYAKVVVPSYFGIIPFVFMQYDSEWRIINALKLTSDGSEMFGPFEDNTVDTKLSLFEGENNFQVYESDFNPNHNSSGRLAIPVEVFFSKIQYLYPYMQNFVMGYSNTQQEVLCKYFYSQLFNSYYLFIKLMGMNEYYGENLQMCDCGVKVGKFFVPYSQDFIVLGDNSKKKSSYAIEVGDGFIVDNFIAYYDNKLISLHSGVTVSTSGKSDIQMRHGILVGWNGSQYVQLQ